MVKLRKRWTDDRFGQTVTRLETTVCLIQRDLVISPRDRVSRPDKMHETVPHTSYEINFSAMGEIGDKVNKECRHSLDS